jgi:adenine-specific DNA methylase
MKAIIDTSSFLAIVRYYLPFDNNDALKLFIEAKVKNDEIIIIDKVYDESKYIAQGLILKDLDFLKNKDFHIKTTDILPNKAFFNMLENQFCNKDVKKLKNISDVEFESEKDRFLNTADAKMLLLAQTIKADAPIIITEETKVANDSKLFRKLPELCGFINIDCCTLPVLLRERFNLDLSKFLK